MDIVAILGMAAAITTLINSIVIVIAAYKISKLEERINAIEYREWRSNHE